MNSSLSRVFVGFFFLVAREIQGLFGGTFFPSLAVTSWGRKVINGVGLMYAWRGNFPRIFENFCAWLYFLRNFSVICQRSIKKCKGNFISKSRESLKCRQRKLSRCEHLLHYLKAIHNKKSNLQVIHVNVRDVNSPRRRHSSAIEIARNFQKFPSAQISPGSPLSRRLDLARAQAQNLLTNRRSIDIRSFPSDR